MVAESTLELPYWRPHHDAAFIFKDACKSSHLESVSVVAHSLIFKAISHLIVR